MARAAAHRKADAPETLSIRGRNGPHAPWPQRAPRISAATPLTTGARSWSIFKGWIRTLIADYGATAAVVFFCAVPYWGNNRRLTPQYEDQGNSNMTIATLEVRSRRVCTHCSTASLPRRTA